MSDAAVKPPPATPRWRWLGLVRLPQRMRRQVLGVSVTLAERMGPTVSWLGAGVVLGVGPLLFDYWLGWPTHQYVVPFAVFPLLLAAVAQDAFLRGTCLLAALLLSQCVLAVALSAWAPERMAQILPGGADYWDKSLAWIRGFENPEYEPSSWLPAQLQLLGAFVLFAYLSAGLAPLWQGFFEIGLMNYYVGRLITCSADPVLALGVGWHPWSLCRGLGYLLLTFEMSSLSLEQLTGSTLSTRRRRLARWAAGLTFLTLDIVVKYHSMATVRELLAANMIDGD